MEDADDPFAAIMKLCQPTTSQLAKFPICPIDRESDDFLDPNPDPDPDPFPFPPAGSQNSADQLTEDNAVFHTPPEHHLQSNFSSSEDLNPNDLCAHGAGTVDLDASKKDRVELKKEVRVPGKGVGSGAVSNKGIVNEIRRTDLGSEDSDEGTMAVDSQYTMKEVTVEVGVAGISADLKKQRASIVDTGDEDHGLGSKLDEPMRDIGVDRVNNNYVSSDISGSMVLGEAEEALVNLRCLVAGNKLGKAVKVSGNEKMSKDGTRDEGRRTACRRIEEIDEFRFSGWVDVGRKWKNIPVPSKRKRELPASMVEMEKNEGRSNVVRQGAAKSGRLNHGKGKEGGIDVVGKVEIKSDQLNRGNGKNKERSNGTEMREAKNDKLENGKESNYEGGIVAGEMETVSDQLNHLAGKAEAKIGQLDDGEGKNEGRSNVAGMVEKKSGLLDILGTLKTVIKNLDNDGQNDNDNVDFLETAKKQGVTFPRPRWWPPEGEEM